jgi:hypothetical protein
MIERKKLIVPAVLALVLGLGVAISSLSGCVSTGSGQGIELIENMSEASFLKWRLYISLTTKVVASRLADEGLVSREELGLAAQALKLVRDGEVPPDLSVGSLLKPALEKVGLKDSEIELALLVIEQELLQRVPLIVDPGTGLVQLSDRTKSVLSEMANSLEAAAVQPATPAESKQAAQLQAELAQ